MKTFKMVPHAQASTYFLLGWHHRLGLGGCCHGDYSIMMEWLCTCPMRMPKGGAQ